MQTNEANDSQILFRLGQTGALAITGRLPTSNLDY